ncbi:MAG: lactate utilization protein C [Chloroflexota bacterium]|nr:lactate utilization protein C [Chloroflexota bacterium]
MSGARAEILGRIKRALPDIPGDETAADVPVQRAYRRTGSPSADDLVTRFADRVSEYKARVRVVAAGELPAAIAAACARRGVRRLVVPPDLPPHWAPDGVELLRDEGLSNTALDESDGVLTGCALGIAQTGTLVLDGGAHQGRRAISLLPDYHLCVVDAAQIVDLVPEAVERLYPAAREARRPVTFISGPSATSDIELNRVEGVHGPRTLEVLIVE